MLTNNRENHVKGIEKYLTIFYKFSLSLIWTSNSQKWQNQKCEWSLSTWKDVQSHW